MSDVQYVRAIEPAGLYHPEHHMWVNIDPAVPIRSDDPLVLAFPSKFIADSDREMDAVVEQATAAPGERRFTRRRG